MCALATANPQLGGKSPVIIAPDADLKITCRRMMSIKALGVGQVGTYLQTFLTHQMCVSPDYVLVPKDLVDQFIDVLIKT